MLRRTRDSRLYGRGHRGCCKSRIRARGIDDFGSAELVVIIFALGRVPRVGRLDRAAGEATGRQKTVGPSHKISSGAKTVHNVSFPSGFRFYANSVQHTVAKRRDHE